ncbi:mRNA cap guanine-N7 methyltransferase [Atheta coriaria]|uniref:mRNA cap guanine-N7 methyltransferase n=1 Tax=Dalotia coriaria TaxID=877792 RepID=UPI0031F3F06D
MSTDGDDLEKTLMMAAADADARNNENRVSVIKSLETVVNETASLQMEPPLLIPQESKGLKRKLQAEREEKRSYDDERVRNERAKKRGESPQPQPPPPEPAPAHSGGYAKVVATHYNQLEEKGLDERSRSRIFYMRNFHNWIKSMQINENLEACKEKKKHNVPIRVMDMCCGKGGDLLKWRKGCINHLICTDIAEVSLDQCKTRYQEMKDRRDRTPGQIYSAEYIAADATKVRLREKYKDPSIKLDLVSCQFAFHYSFESLPQAECMIRNGAECLQPGGFFFGTIPDANEIVARLKKAGRKTFGNDVFSVVYDSDLDNPPIFGAKYNFHLDGVVDCPEFLVHFGSFVKLAKKYGLKLVRKEKFHEFYQRLKNEGRNLLSAMNSLETYSSQGRECLVGTNPEDYKHAEEYCKEKDTDAPVGTLSKSEWEASSLYMTFTFEKVKNDWNDDGTPKYIFD